MNTSIWVKKPILQDLNTAVKNTLTTHLGITFVEVGDASLTARMTIHDSHRQPMGIMHGGATAALAESVASTAANYCVDQTNKICVGVELNINHLKAVKEGHVDAVALPLHLGKTTQVWEIKIYNSKSLLVSAARLTLSVINKN